MSNTLAQPYSGAEKLVLGIDIGTTSCESLSRSLESSVEHND